MQLCTGITQPPLLYTRWDSGVKHEILLAGEVYSLFRTQFIGKFIDTYEVSPLTCDTWQVDVCVCVCRTGSPLPLGQALCSLMMYETGSPLEYHRNMTAEQQRSSIMETDGTAPTLLTLSRTKTESARHCRIQQSPWKALTGALVSEDSTWQWPVSVPPQPDRWIDEGMEG